MINDETRSIMTEIPKQVKNLAEKLRPDIIPNIKQYLGLDIVQEKETREKNRQSTPKSEGCIVNISGVSFCLPLLLRCALRAYVHALRFYQGLKQMQSPFRVY